MSPDKTRQGIWLMIAAAIVFAVQDGISRHLAGQYNVYMVVMIRYWFFAAFVTALAARQPGGLRAAVATRQPGLQIFRGFLLAGEICVIIQGYVILGLIESHAVFTVYPLIVVALSGPVLGERVGWRRWAAVGIGFVGVVIILDPGTRVFSAAALIPLLAAAIFALYGILTRFASRRDTAAVSFFWTGIAGAVLMTLIGPWFWQPMSAPDWGWMALLCVFAATAHYLLIRALEAAEASAIQPFAYIQLVCVSLIGITVFNETLRLNVVVGAMVVISASLFALWRARRAAQ